MKRGAQTGESATAAPSKPFARPLVIDDVPDEGLGTSIQATHEEDAAVAALLGLPSVSDLAASFRLRWQPGRRLVVTGEVRARVAQVCVVSLEPFESDVRQEIDITFVETKPARPIRASRTRDSRGAARRQAIEAPTTPLTPSEGEDDPPDPIVDGRIDLGGIAVEFLTLALDFYPRKPGVEFHDVVIGEGDDQKPSAFAALERLKDRS